MYFKKLEIFGFKSFADKTILNFEPGITAIVGPNGCGKSNIFDAIRWVLGEQSTKQLRGASMEDVIFNGTSQKPSLGFAEVHLTLANDSRALPIDYDEVTISRRLFRSGESEYLLNKTIVRLKDIQELLMGTGIGAEAYSLVQQGKVDLVVSARPEDRRMIFDEASGITKYKAKKKEALNKLKDTENNLLRINDIVIEVKRQIGSIERQAGKARKYKEEFQKLEEMELRLAKHQMQSLGDQKEKMDAQIQAFRVKEREIGAGLDEQAGLLTREINCLEELEQKINELYGEQIKLDGQMDLNNRQMGFNQERIEGIEQNRRKISDQKGQLIERCRMQQEKIEELKQDLAVIEETLQFNEQQLKEKRDFLERFEASLREAKDRIAGNEEKVLNLTSQQMSIRNEVTDVMKEIQGALARKRRLEIDREKIAGEKKALDEKMQGLDSDVCRLLEEMRKIEQDKENQGRLLDHLRAELNGLKQAIDELEKKALFYKSQKDFIEKLHAQYQDIPDPIVEGRLITSTPPLDHHTGIIGKVKGVSVSNGGRPGFWRSIFRRSGARKLYEIICEAKFIELDPQQISRKIEEIERDVQRLTLDKQARIEKIEQEAQLYRVIQKTIHDQEKVLSVVNAQKKDIFEEAGRLKGEMELNSSEMQDVDGFLTVIAKREEELNYKLDTVTQDIQWCQNDIKNKQEWIAGKSQDKEEMTVSVAQIGAEIESQQDKLKSSREHHNMFSKDLDGGLDAIHTIEDELAQQETRRAGLDRETQALMEQIVAAKHAKESLKAVLNNYERQKEDLAQRINSLRAQMDAFEDEADAIRQNIHGEELRKQELNFKEKGLKDRILQAYKIHMDEMSSDSSQGTSTGNQEAPAPCELMDVDQLVMEIEALRKRCDSFGSVNLVAIEEYEELKERFEFLTKQQGDLLEAKSQLMNTISKINRSTRQQFLDIFAKVGEEFRVYFRMLFGGGDADLILMDPENVLESGIDIVARPPGKKLQNISLLSGGEKTLTAIALIFGVFKVNPSPFCILDEIDAALDESNVGRFSYLLKDFAKIAQFIVITHNKKTISSADIMYGITMPETGVSRIVSVKFSDEKEKQQEKELVAA